MNLDKVLHRFAASPRDRAELRRLARALGSELTREHLDTLRTARASLASLPLFAPNQNHADSRSYASGYVAGILDISAEYESTMRHEHGVATLEQMILREDCQRLLSLLRQEPRSPSELADALGEDQATIMRRLQKLRAAGLLLVHGSDSLDSHQRPHRLSLDGRRLLDRLDARLSSDISRGICLAVEIFRYLLTHTSSSSSTLEAIANEQLQNPLAAADAVQVWAMAARHAGLVTADNMQSPNVPSPVAAMGSIPADRPSDVLWNAAPWLLRQIEKRASETVPLYIRTNDQAWGAWAFAIGQGYGKGQSRTIVDGDIVSRSVQPPEKRFHLLYDHPAAIQNDRHEPTMQAFMEQAEQKYVVTGPDDDDSDIPDEFIPLKITPYVDLTEITAVD